MLRQEVLSALGSMMTIVGSSSYSAIRAADPAKVVAAIEMLSLRTPHRLTISRPIGRIAGRTLFGYGYHRPSAFAWRRL
ncbi:MAG: hypothetical protein QOK29_223 [Rhodospirillaceae bacterium]|jgi:hypothetical protein|nr:hypothetical protein [Rhodospirillaceae bacterium]